MYILQQVFTVCRCAGTVYSFRQCNFTRCSALLALQHRNAVEIFITPLMMYGIQIYVGKSINKIQIQVATYVFELSAGNCHR